MEAALAQLKRAGTLVLVGAGMARPKFDPNRILLNELVITGAFVYDHDGFARALELLASGKLPDDLLVEPEDYPLNRLLDTALGLHEGTVAAKAMIVPRVRRSTYDSTETMRRAELRVAQAALQPRRDEPVGRRARRGAPQGCAPTSSATFSASTTCR